MLGCVGGCVRERDSGVHPTQAGRKPLQARVSLIAGKVPQDPSAPIAIWTRRCARGVVPAPGVLLLQRCRGVRWLAAIEPEKELALISSSPLSHPKPSELSDCPPTVIVGQQQVWGPFPKTPSPSSLLSSRIIECRGAFYHSSCC